MAADSIANFIARWAASEGAERANCQLFLTQLCDLLAVPHSEPTKATAEDPSKRFLLAKSAQVEEILAALCSLGLARQVRGKYLPP